MKIQVLEEKENPLLQRRELKITADYEGGPTPKNIDLAEALAKQLNADKDVVDIRRFLSSAGRTAGTALVYIWASAGARESAKLKKKAKTTKAAKAESGKK